MFQQVTAVFAGFLALPAAAAAAPGSSVEPHGIPFSMADLGWLALGAMVLLVISLVLQAIARHRRSTTRGAAGVAVAPQRTES